MLQHTYYTAVGHYLCKTDEAGRTYPVVICHQKEYSVDLQEMTLWTALNWRLAGPGGRLSSSTRSWPAI